MLNSFMVKTAIILAAGFGDRLQAIWDGKPKAFLPIKDVSLIERSLAHLRACGIERVVIGTGHIAGSFEDLKTRHPYVETVFSSDYATTSSFATLMKMRNMVREDVLLLESDLLYDRVAIEHLQRCSEPDVVLSSDITDLGDEVFLEVNDRLQLVDVSKDRAALASIHSVLVGINKLSASYLRELFAEGDAILARNPRVDYEKALAQLHGRKPIQVIALPQLAWTEIDTPEHYQYAVSNVLPRITRS